MANNIEILLYNNVNQGIMKKLIKSNISYDCFLIVYN